MNNLTQRLQLPENVIACLDSELSAQGNTLGTGGAVEFNLSPEPAFLNDDSQTYDPPFFITTSTARELFGLLPGETVAQAALRKVS